MKIFQLIIRFSWLEASNRKLTEYNYRRHRLNRTSLSTSFSCFKAFHFFYSLKFRIYKILLDATVAEFEMCHFPWFWCKGLIRGSEEEASKSQSFGLIYRLRIKLFIPHPIVRWKRLKISDYKNIFISEEFRSWK